ncbi:MAG TPA: hypothetical protein EYP19_06455, partial [Desulfobacterales bacterium]|nr:hypothetical protein [Desulfobacterales bacterium]
MTNGVSLHGETALRLLELKLDRLFVSLDGLEEGTDAPGYVKCAATVTKNLMAFSQLRIRRRVLKPRVGIIFVATRENIGKLPELRRKASILGFTSILVS